MTMYRNITEADFRDAFRDMGRGDQFTYHGLGLLFEHLEELQDATGEPIELDVIALCCDYSEDTLAELAENNGIEEDEVLDYLNERTSVVGETEGGTVVYAAF
jgi:hypothetical protein